MADAREVIRDKRDGRTHAAGDIAGLMASYVAGDVPDYQVSAWLMAAFLKGLDEAETRELTRALLDSGRRFDWTPLGKPSADKHSTGGVGDKISLPLAPLVAACGVMVPMVSGRGLGHTGGTLDKLESMPGFRTTLAPDALRDQLAKIGLFMVGQGPDLAPADGRLYALRDVTSTVEFEPFIVASIVSKKIAEGAGALVYDVKCGDGAFMREPERARGLASRLVAATRGLGAKASAFVTDMSQPLGEAVGNALEVRESVDVLRGGGPPDVRDLTLDLAARMLVLAGADADDATARARAAKALASGAAWQTFLELVRAQGGDVAAMDRAEPALARAPHVEPVKADRSGVLAAVRCFAMGEAVVRMGGGRLAKEDAIDPAVGLMVRRRIGDTVNAGDVLAEAHLAKPDAAMVDRVRACFVIGDAPVKLPRLVVERID
jgi:pyrimidine-nucleoside phosphorylase